MTFTAIDSSSTFKIRGSWILGRLNSLLVVNEGQI